MPLNDTTKQSLVNHINQWRRIGLATGASDKNATERFIAQAYTIVGLPAPQRFVWVKSPMAGAVAAAQCVTIFPSVSQRVWRKPQEFMTKRLWGKAADKNQIEYWTDIDNFISRSPLMVIRDNVMIPICQQIVDQGNEKNRQARASVFVSGRHAVSNLSTEIWASALTGMKAVLTQKEIRDIGGTPSWEKITEQLQACGYGSMDAIFLALLDYANMQGLNLTDISGIAGVAKNAGLWWPLKDICVVSERPKVLALNKQGQLHMENAMAVEYEDNWGVYALNGKTVARDVAQTAVKIPVE